MSEPVKLSDEAFAAIENRSCRSDYPLSWAAGDVERLIDHVRAIEAEHKNQLAAAAAQAREDADRVGKARIEFEEGQTQRIADLQRREAVVWEYLLWLDVLYNRTMNEKGEVNRGWLGERLTELLNEQDFNNQYQQRLAELTDETDSQRERLKRQDAFVTAMQSIVDDAHNDHHLATNWATERIKKALDILAKSLARKGTDDVSENRTAG